MSEQVGVDPTTAYVKPRFPVWLVRGGSVSLVVDSAPEVFLRSLKAETGGMYFPALSGRSLIGRVSLDGAILVSANTPFVNNGWRSFLDASVVPFNAGSLIQGRFRLSRPIAVFSVVWLLFTGLISVSDVLRFRVDSLLIPLVAIGIIAVARVFALAGEKRAVAELSRIGRNSVEAQP